MNLPVNHKLAKLLKEKGFNELCSNLYFDGKLNEITIQKVNYDDTLSSRYYIAPTIAEVLMWLFKTREIWIEVYYDNSRKEFYTVLNGEEYKFKSPTEAYEAAIEYVLNNLI